MAKPLGGKAAGLQQGPCQGGRHIITLCCVKDCLCLMGVSLDPHTTFPREQWCRRKVSRCAATLWVIQCLIIHLGGGRRHMAVSVWGNNTPISLWLHFLR